MSRLDHARQIHASLVMSLSEVSKTTIKILMDEIPALRTHVPNENMAEISVIEGLQAFGRKVDGNGRKGDFCINLVHSVLKMNPFIFNGAENVPLPLFQAPTTPSVVTRVSPGISPQGSVSTVRNTGASYSCPAQLINAKRCFDLKYEDTIEWMLSKERMFSFLVTTFLKLHTQWSTLKITGEALNSKIINPTLTNDISSFMDSVDSFRKTPAVDGRVLFGFEKISTLNKELKLEIWNLKNRVKSQRYKLRKKGTANSCLNKQIDVCGGLGMGLMFDPLHLHGNSKAQLAMVPSMSPDDLETVLATIQEVGFMDVDDVMELCHRGNSLTDIDGSGRSARQNVIASILDLFPVVSVHVHKSSTTFLVDGVQPPEFVFEAMSNDEPVQTCRTSREAEFREEWEKSLESENDMWEKMMDPERSSEIEIEFATDIFNEDRIGREDHECVILKKHPGLLKAITDILEKHGTSYAHSRRRNDKIYHTGVSCRAMSRYLFGEYDIDVSPVTIWRLFTHRKNDKRTVRSGGSYGFIHTELVAKQNSQFCRDNVIGQCFVSLPSSQTLILP